MDRESEAGATFLSDRAKDMRDQYFPQLPPRESTYAKLTAI
jgi:hypothetical protein